MDYVNILFYIFIIIFSLVFHEIGHYLFSIIFKCRVIQCSFGIGPRLFGIKNKNTTYNIRLIPIAAYVQLDLLKSRNYYEHELKEFEKNDWFNIEDSKLTTISYFRKYYKNENKWFYLKKIFKYRSYNENKKRVNLEYNDNKFIFDEMNFFKKILILLGGILFNLILLSIFVLILYAQYKNGFNILEQIGNFYKNLWYVFTWQNHENVVFYIDNYFQLFSIIFININISLIFLNIIPIPPLDGGKIISLVFSKLFLKSKVEKIESIVSLIAILLIGYLSISALIQNIIY